jgi:hypothetical protein
MNLTVLKRAMRAAVTGTLVGSLYFMEAIMLYKAYEEIAVVF